MEIWNGVSGNMDPKNRYTKILVEQTARHWWTHFCRIGTVRCFHQAEYAVYHISDVTCMECLTGEYAHTDEEVIDAACELINQALPATAEGPWLLAGKPVASGTDVYPAGDDQTAAGRNSLSENRIYAGHRSSDAYGIWS